MPDKYLVFEQPGRPVAIRAAAWQSLDTFSSMLLERAPVDWRSHAQTQALHRLTPAVMRQVLDEAGKLMNRRNLYIDHHRSVRKTRDRSDAIDMYYSPEYLEAIKDAVMAIGRERRK